MYNIYLPVYTLYIYVSPVYIKDLSYQQTLVLTTTNPLSSSSSDPFKTCSWKGKKKKNKKSSSLSTEDHVLCVRTGCSGDGRVAAIFFVCCAVSSIVLCGARLLVLVLFIASCEKSWGLSFFTRFKIDN